MPTIGKLQSRTIEVQVSGTTNHDVRQNNEPAAIVFTRIEKEDVYLHPEFWM